MIPYASCMCFGAERNPARRRRQWKLVTAQRGTSMAIGKDDSLCIRFRGSQESIASVLTSSEICMLEALGKVDRYAMPCTEQEVRGGGRRSRQPVITHLVDLHLLDDTYAGVTRTLLSKCNSWSFNTFNLDVSTGGRSLSYLLVHLFQEYGFVEHFNLDIVKVWHCFNLMEAAYHRHNPYHNSVHAADVTQAMHCFLQENKFAAHLTPLEAMSSVIAAVAHDLDHPGVTQAFLVATSNHLVNLYHNSSVLENHHWRTAISCLSESGIFNHLEKDVWFDIQRQIRSLILATDITRQKEFLAKFKNYLNSECLDMENAQYRHFALQIALKCADLCNPCRPWVFSQRWSYQVCQEFYRQGAYERQLKLPLTPTFDCSRTKVAKIQADFFQFVVSPLFETWDHFLKTPLSSKLLENLHHNFSQWQKRMELMQESDSLTNVASMETPQIKIDVCSDSVEFASSSEGIDSRSQLSAEQDVIIKQHRSKSDSGLTPRLLPPKIYMETYSTEELHPSTTLLSLSSITNTVQLRQVYAATKVESHLICPTVFQPIFSNTKPKEIVEDSSPPPEECSDEVCPISVTEIEDTTENDAQCSILTCTDGCGTPSPPENPSSLQVGQTKQRSQSLINDSEVMKYYSQVLQSRRASDFGPYLHKNTTAQKCTPVTSNNSSFSQNQQTGEHLPFLCDESTIQSFTKSYASEVKNSNNIYPNVCSNKLCSTSSCICESSESYHQTPSWCWHISRSFSEERPIRPSQDFDSPLPSWQGSSNSLAYSGRNGRRGSAPVAVSNVLDICGSHLSSLGEIDSKSQKEECEGTAASGRRWSVPSETISDPKLFILGIQLAHMTAKIKKKDCVPVHITRRSSCGILEPLTTMSKPDSTNLTYDISSKPTHSSYSTFASHDVKEKAIKFFANSDSILPSQSSLHQSPVLRRSSLPTEVPIAVMCHVSNPSHLQSDVSGEQFLLPREKPPSKNQPSFLIDRAHKHGSPSDLLSVLIGPSGMLNSMHGIVSGQTICELPCVAQETSRRRSGGLEMLSGFWKSRTSDVIIGVSMASKLKLRSQLLEEWASWRTEEGNIKPIESANSSISALGQKFMYQQRRGSVPLNVSLLSLSSGK